MTILHIQIAIIAIIYGLKCNRRLEQYLFALMFWLNVFAAVWYTYK